MAHEMLPNAHAPVNFSRGAGSSDASERVAGTIKCAVSREAGDCQVLAESMSAPAAVWRKDRSSLGAGGGNRTHSLGIMRPSLYH